MPEIATPTLQTARLVLRPLALSDAPDIQRHFNNWNIIRHLARVVPWPYPDDGAESFVKGELGKIAAGEEIYHWILTLQPGDGEAIGNIHSARGRRARKAIAASGSRSRTGIRA